MAVEFHRPVQDAENDHGIAGCESADENPPWRLHDAIL
jgi:hypothetical protein